MGYDRLNLTIPSHNVSLAGNSRRFKSARTLMINGIVYGWLGVTAGTARSHLTYSYTDPFEVVV